MGVQIETQRETDLLRDIPAWGIFTTLKIHQFVCFF